jgi:diaminohydroxyphosphoribosylaminopyrimidine deaminase / 5-amino-6-(5-phosphoribosylamino)uracil reductase
MNQHKAFMQIALDLAEKGRASSSPNPMVGCVVVKSGKIVGRGYHQKAGDWHAEVYALREAGKKAEGATLYTTLEPCSHWGRTPPCTQAIIKAGIKEVVIALKDPNWRIHGIEELKKHKIRAITGVLEKEARKQNEVFVKFISTHMPFVILKIASTKDGFIAPIGGVGKYQITSRSSRTLVHKIRTEVDAVMVGRRTVETDNPLLTPRLFKGKDPFKVVVDSTLAIPLESNLFRRPKKLIIATTSKSPISIIKSIEKKGAAVLMCHQKNGKVDITDMMKKLAQSKISSVLLESGGALGENAIREKTVDKVALFVSPKVFEEGIPAFFRQGGKSIENAISLKQRTKRMIGEDVLIEGYI